MLAGTIKEQSLKEQVLQASIKILQQSLDNLTFLSRTEGMEELHPVSNTTISIQCYGDVVIQTNFWSLLEAFRTPDIGRIRGLLADGLRYKAIINGQEITKIEWVGDTIYLSV